MKKLALSLAVLFAVGMVSCGGNKDKENCGDTTVTEEVGVIDVTTDSLNPDSTQVTEAGAAVAETTPAAPEAKADAKADNKEEAKDAKADAAAPAADAPADGAAAPADAPAK